MIGRAQRRKVWAQLLSAFPRGSRILELNCGTGEDARYLVERGRSVVACDASRSMIQVAKRRSPLGDSANLEFLTLANEDLGFIPSERVLMSVLELFGFELPCRSAPFREQPGGSSKTGRCGVVMSLEPSMRCRVFLVFAPRPIWCVFEVFPGRLLQRLRCNDRSRLSHD